MNFRHRGNSKQSVSAPHLGAWRPLSDHVLLFCQSYGVLRYDFCGVFIAKIYGNFATDSPFRPVYFVNLALRDFYSIFLDTNYYWLSLWHDFARIYAKNVQILRFLPMREPPVLTRHNPFPIVFFNKSPSMALLLANYAFTYTYTGVLCRNLCKILIFMPKMPSVDQPF